MKDLIVPLERIERLIYLIRGHRVMVDADLAELYGVPTRRLNEQVKRNKVRFPSDFTFQLTEEEARIYQCSRSQFAIFKRGQNIKYLPHAFTEHGAIMAANVLNSKQAVVMSVEVVRAFVRLREMIVNNKVLAAKLSELESKMENQNKDIKTLFAAIHQLMEPPPELPKRRIGFHTTKD